MGKSLDYDYRVKRDDFTSLIAQELNRSEAFKCANLQTSVHTVEIVV